MLIAYYFMWHTGHPAAEQCEGYALYTAQVCELSFWWEDSPTGWPQPWKDDEEENPYRADGRPIVQWPRVKAGHSDDLRTGTR